MVLINFLLLSSFYKATLSNNNNKSKQKNKPNKKK